MKTFNLIWYVQNMFVPVIGNKNRYMQGKLHGEGDKKNSNVLLHNFAYNNTALHEIIEYSI